MDNPTPFHKQLLPPEVPIVQYISRLYMLSYFQFYTLHSLLSCSDLRAGFRCYRGFLQLPSDYPIHKSAVLVAAAAEV